MKPMLITFLGTVVRRAWKLKAASHTVERQDRAARICAWHEEYFSFELVMEEGSLPATHGICSDCYAITMHRQS